MSNSIGGTDRLGKLIAAYPVHPRQQVDQQHDPVYTR